MTLIRLLRRIGAFTVSQEEIAAYERLSRMNRRRGSHGATDLLIRLVVPVIVLVLVLPSPIVVTVKDGSGKAIHGAAFVGPDGTRIEVDGAGRASVPAAWAGKAGELTLPNGKSVELLIASNESYTVIQQS